MPPRAEGSDPATSYPSLTLSAALAPLPSDRHFLKLPQLFRPQISSLDFQFLIVPCAPQGLTLLELVSSVPSILMQVPLRKLLGAVAWMVGVIWDQVACE